MMPSTPPVLLIGFNRPNETIKVFEKIKLARPNKLYIACDGPRSAKSGEAELVAQVRQLVLGVDWPCELKTRFLDENLGCGRAVSSAIEWFLNEVKEGIILEDDCLPTPAFFRFCAVMLERYRNDNRVGLISGTNMAPEVKFVGDYSFSRIITCWGWATWQRTWIDYRLIPDEIKSDEPWASFFNGKSFNTLKDSFKKINEGDAHTWDYQLLVQMLRTHQLTVIPRRNLVLNIGFSGTGTHFSSSGRPWWVPSCAFDFKGDWLREIDVKACHQFDLHYKASSHGGGGKLLRVWIKFLRKTHHFFQCITSRPTLLE